MKRGGTNYNVDYDSEPSLYGFDTHDNTYATFNETWGAEPGDTMTVSTERRSWSGQVYEVTDRYTTVRTADDFESTAIEQLDYMEGSGQ